MYKDVPRSHKRASRATATTPPTSMTATIADALPSETPTQATPVPASTAHAAVCVDLPAAGAGSSAAIALNETLSELTPGAWGKCYRPSLSKLENECFTFHHGKRPGRLTRPRGQPAA